MKDINCPYCDHAQDINHDDGYGYEEDISHQNQCKSCEKNFIFYTSISYYYRPHKADCLNGGDHNYEPTNTFPPRFSMMRCTMCDDERVPTQEEMNKIISKSIRDIK